jgi:hypothetical protein
MNAYEADLVQQWGAADIARESRRGDFYTVSDESDASSFHDDEIKRP